MLFTTELKCVVALRPNSHAKKVCKSNFVTLKVEKLSHFQAAAPFSFFLIKYET